MDGSAGALAVAATGLAVAAVALARFGLRQRSYRGWRFWVGAVGLGAAACGLAAADAAAGLSIVPLHALLAPWPLLTLIGLRRFHARIGLVLDERVDWGVLVVATLAALAADASWSAGVAGALGAVAILVVGGYTAAMLATSHGTEDTVALRFIAVAVVVATLPAFAALVSNGIAGGAGRHSVAFGAAFGQAVTVFVLLTLMGERTERELRDSRRRLRVLANTDPLTGVSNRRHFHELATRSFGLPGEPRAILLMFDIDHFKLINDRLGHSAGDRALRLVGRCMQEALRAQDIAGRLGGDEFVLVLRGASVQQAIAVAGRIVDRLQAQSIEHRLPCLGLSFGAVQVIDGEGVDEALRRADQALYEAKRQGRSRVVAASGNEDEPVFSESQRLGLTAV